MISRLILAGLSRFVMNDFRTGKYFNVGLLSSAAASMLFLRAPAQGFQQRCGCGTAPVDPQYRSNRKSHDHLRNEPDPDFMDLV